MSGWWFHPKAPSSEPPPEVGYSTLFISTGEESTVAGGLYRKDPDGSITLIGPYPSAGAGGGGTGGGGSPSNDFVIDNETSGDAYTRANINGTVHDLTDATAKTVAVTDSTDATYVFGSYVADLVTYKHVVTIQLSDIGAFAIGKGAIESFTFTVRFQNSMGTAYLSVISPAGFVVATRLDAGVQSPAFSPFAGSGVVEVTAGTFFAGPNLTFADGYLADAPFNIAVWGKETAAGTDADQPRIYSVRVNVKYAS